MSARTKRMVLQGDRIAPHAVEWLAQAGRIRIHSLHQNVINLIAGHGDLFSVVSPPLGPGPFALLLQPPPPDFHNAGGFGGILELEVPVRMQPGALELGSIQVSLTHLRHWAPQPDWAGLHGCFTAAVVEELGRLLQAHAPPASLAPVANRAWWPEQHRGVDLASAQLRTIAGRAEQLLKGLMGLGKGPIQQAASRLAGLGGGVTPAGDDFLLGAIHALWTTRDAGIAEDLSTAAVQAAAPRTNAVSAAWLRAAARGEAADEWHSLFEAVIQQGPISGAARRLLQRGHTSGADALAGFVAAGRALVGSADARRLIAVPG